MSKIMDELLGLFAIDREAIGLKERMAAGPREVAHQEELVAAAREKRKQAETAIKEKMSAIDEYNLDIKSYEGELEDQQIKLNAIKSNKEYQIVSDRIKQLKQQISEKENGALEAMEELEGQRQDFKECQDGLAEEERKLEKVRADIEAESKSIQGRVQDIKSRRKLQVERVKTVDGKALEVYNFSLKRGKGQALTEMNGTTCQSCFRQQSAQTENMVLVGTDIAKCRCTVCGRILYLKA